MLRMGFDQAMLDLYLCAKSAKAFDVLVNRPAADIAAAGKRNLCVLIFAQKCSDQVIGGPDLLDIFILYYKLMNL